MSVLVFFFVVLLFLFFLNRLPPTGLLRVAATRAPRGLEGPKKMQNAPVKGGVRRGLKGKR